MAWIETVAQEQAAGQLASVYRRAGARSGQVANVLKIQSLNPRALEGHMGLYRAVMFAESPLSRQQRELLAVWVSQLNQCHY